MRHYLCQNIGNKPHGHQTEEVHQNSPPDDLGVCVGRQRDYPDAAYLAHKGIVELKIANPESGPSPAEMQKAVQQLRDIPRFLPFFVFIVVPMPGVTEGYVLLAISLEKWMGKRISLLPSQFRKVFQPTNDSKSLN